MTTTINSLSISYQSSRNVRRLVLRVNGKLAHLNRWDARTKCDRAELDAEAMLRKVAAEHGVSVAAVEKVFSDSLSIKFTLKAVLA